MTEGYAGRMRCSIDLGQRHPDVFESIQVEGDIWQTAALLSEWNDDCQLVAGLGKHPPADQGSRPEMIGYSDGQ